MDSYIVIDGWRSNIRFSSAHIIPDYEKCGRLHGHTYAVHLKVFGKPDENGIIMDFSSLKETVKKVVNELDHKVLIPEKSGFMTIKKEDDVVKLSLSSLKKKYVFPIDDCVLLPIDSTSAENLADYILEKIVRMMSISKRIKNIEVGVDEGFGQGARVSKTI